MKKQILEYLGIEETYLNDTIIKDIANEVRKITNKYNAQIKNDEYHYAFDEDIPRFYNKEYENVTIIERLKYITVFKISKN